MPITDVIAEVRGERKARKSAGKHYIPFNAAEWEKLKAGLGTPNLQPQDLKDLLTAIAADRVGLQSKAKKVA